ncbi:MAG: hypothetical protein IT319_21090 [Anaerolineae bacterium]|nr:hypothetical protein [Anaerolineae bacterium]
MWRQPARLIGIGLLLLALTIGSVSAQDAGGLTIEFFGTVQSASGTVAAINGQIVDVSSAQINAPLVAGTTVRVHATLAADGRLIAREIDPAAPGLIPGIVEIEGTITAVNGSAITIGGALFDIASAGISDQLAVGQMVRVYAVAAAPRQWNALLVVNAGILQQPATLAAIPEATAIPAVLATPEVGEDFEIFGTVTAFDGTSITIDGQRFIVGSARLDSGIAVGVAVRMEIRVINGQWVIEEIETANRVGDDRGGSGRSSDDAAGDDRGGSGHGSDDSGGDDRGGHGGDD